MNPTKWRSGSSGLSADRIWLACLIVASVLLLLLSRSETAFLRLIQTSIAELSAPALRGLSGPVADIRSRISNLGSYSYLVDEVARLREENRQLRAMRSTIDGLENRVKRYEALLKATPGPEAKPIAAARILADRGSPFVRTALIDAGGKHGVIEGLAVVDARGLVGQTIAVGPTTSRVLLLNDLNSRVPVQIEPFGYRAILAGTNTKTPRLEFLPIGAQIRPGNEVVTSGHGGLFPAGLPVGTVKSVKLGVVEATLNAPTDSVGVVRVLEPVEIKIPEEAESVEAGAEDEQTAEAGKPDSNAVALKPKVRGRQSGERN